MSVLLQVHEQPDNTMDNINGTNQSRSTPAAYSAHYQLPLQRQRQYQQAQTHTSVSAPQTSTPMTDSLHTIIATLPHALRNLHASFSQRFDRLDVLVSQSACGTTPPTQETAHAALTATLRSLSEKLVKIENDLVDVQSVDTLRGSLGSTDTSELATRVGRLEAFVETTGGAVADEVKEIKGRISNVELLLRDSLESIRGSRAEGRC